MHLCCQNQKDVPYNVVPSVLSWQRFQLLKSEMFLYNFAEFFFLYEKLMNLMGRNISELA